MNGKSLSRTVALLIAISIFLPMRYLLAASNTVWQIGTFDESSHEFRSGSIDYNNPASDPVYVVGESKPAKDWYAFQPGTSNGHAGYRTHPFTVEFTLPAKPSGLFTLRLSLLHYSPRLPLIGVSVNGHSGWFYQHPQSSYSRGDVADLFIPQYSMVHITADIPTHFLRAGRNKLVLSAQDSPNKRDDSQGATAVVGNSGITYDALALERDSNRTYPSSLINVETVPTIFYKSDGGHLKEVVDVYVRSGAPLRRTAVTLAMEGQKFFKTLSSDCDFGEQKVEFEVPEFTSPVKAKINVSIGRHSRLFLLDLSPGKKWNIFVVPQEHLDIGYTDYPPKVAAIQSRVIDEAMSMIRRHPDFRWTLDGYWCAEQYLAARSKSRQEQFLELVREGKIFVPAQYAPILTGFPSMENLIRSFYPSYEFAKQHSGGFDDAISTDVPSHSWSYASALAAAGLKYFLPASNSMFGPMLVLGRLNERSPFWWRGPDGKKILVWVSRHYHQVASMFGLPPQVAAVHDSLPIFLQTYSHPNYHSNGVIVFGTQWENTDLYRGQAGLAAAWNGQYTYPKLQYSGVAEAMKYIAGQFGNRIPTLRGGGGSYWEASLARHPFFVALGRANEQRALTAEKFSTIASLVDPGVRPERVALRRLWENLLLFDSHTWGGGGENPNSPLRVLLSKSVVATESKRQLEQVLMRSAAAIADSVHDPARTLIVFNPLNWPRSALVELGLAKGRELVDLTTKQKVPYETLSEGQGFRRIAFIASKVPAVGYKCYSIKQARSEVYKRTTETTNVLESSAYRITLDPASGAVQSIVDKELRREMVSSSSPYRFDEALCVTGKEDEGNLIGLSSRIAPPAPLVVHKAGKGRIVSVTKTPFGTVARLESSIPDSCPIETEIILFNGQKKVEFINKVPKTCARAKGSLYLAFPFAMHHPQFHYEIQNGVVDPAVNMLPGGGLEVFSVQHWVAVEQGEVSAAIIPVDAPLVTLGDVDRHTWPTKFGQRQATIFSYAAQHVGSAARKHALTFRYVLRSGRNLNDAMLSRFGWQALTPLESDEIIPNDKVDNPIRPLNAKSGSFLQVDAPNVVLVTWKLAEDGKGTILRFLEVGGEARTVNVKIPILHISAAWKCNGVEEDQQPLSVTAQGFSFGVKPHEIVTIRLVAIPIGQETEGGS